MPVPKDPSMMFNRAQRAPKILLPHKPPPLRVERAVDQASHVGTSKEFFLQTNQSLSQAFLGVKHLREKKRLSIKSHHQRSINQTIPAKIKNTI